MVRRCSTYPIRVLSFCTGPCHAADFHLVGRIGTPTCEHLAKHSLGAEVKETADVAGSIAFRRVRYAYDGA